MSEIVERLKTEAIGRKQIREASIATDFGEDYLELHPVEVALFLEWKAAAEITRLEAIVERQRASLAELLPILERQFSQLPPCPESVAWQTAHARLVRGRAAIETEKEKPTMTEAQIKHMVNRFLGWKLPEHFRPDAGISFKADYNEHTAHPMKHEPVGTNLLDAQQAEAMVRHMIEGLPNDFDLGGLRTMDKFSQS